MASRGQNHSRAGGSSFEQVNLHLKEYPVTELTKALGCPRENEMEVTRALIELSTIACSRFGVPWTSQEAVRSLINAPSKADLLAKPLHLPTDARWERLAEAILPPVPDGFPIAALRTTSESTLEVLKESVASLAADLRELRLKPISDTTAMTLRGSIKSVREIATQNSEWREEGLRAARQLAIYHEVGPQWSMVTPLEHLFLVWCATPEEPATTASTGPASARSIARNDRLAPPDPKLLQPLGLIWKWCETRTSWEPTPKSSKYQNSTLFDLSSRYFEARLDRGDMPLGLATKRLFEELRDARRAYEVARGGVDDTQALRTLHMQQASILDRLLSSR